ncbi:hypothetical protein NM688_g8065 [Phlebia brevispora]|uniref:Uncharacterized protein n=1 Tax=Phlebia brevispora TaxID=194682 RepID=A0ACC1RXU7_9APHY|nr:hypothetical protein NM688_g8065 [Phlebia brevispora]
MSSLAVKHFPSGILRSRFSPERGMTPPPNCLRRIYNTDAAIVADKPNEADSKEPAAPTAEIPPMKGFPNLAKVMHLSDGEFNDIKDTVHRLARDRLDCERTISKQDKTNLSEVCNEAARIHPALNRYQSHWVTKDILKRFLGRRRQTLKMVKTE